VVPWAALAAAGCGDKDTGGPADSGTDTGEVVDDACEDPVTLYFDADGDGYGVLDSALSTCEEPAGYVAQAGDCDDIAVEVHPGVIEACNGVDDDCDGLIDPEGSEGQFWSFADADEDGYGSEAGGVLACEAPSGFVSNTGDCDDTEPLAWTGAEEVCGDGVDNNCDGEAGDCSLAESGDVVELGFPFLRGTEQRGGAGSALAATDLSGDGALDLLVGASRVDDVGTLLGQVWIHPGAIPGGEQDLNNGYPYQGDVDGGLFGASVAGVGDANSDGYNDFVVGAPGVVAAASTGVGKIYFFAGPLSAGSRTPADALVTLVAEQTQASIGVAMVAGDVTGDGVVDLIIGAEGAPTDTTSFGGFWVVSRTVDFDTDLEEAGTWFSEESKGDGTGTVLAIVGDTDGDGLNDLVAGAPNWGQSVPEAGRVVLLLGPPPSAGGSVVDADASVDGQTPTGAFGRSLAGGDLDGDGHADLVVGARDDGDYSSFAGAAYVFLGPISEDAALGDAMTVVYGDGTSDDVGTGLAVVDLDGDGAPELAVTDPAGGAGTGGAGVWFGPPASGAYKASDADRFYSAPNAGDGGAAVLLGTGDLGADGTNDLVLGLPSWQTADYNGAVSIIQGGAGF
jgi:hypothetical protein